MNFPRRKVRDNNGHQVTEELWQEGGVSNLRLNDQRTQEDGLMDRNTVSKTLSKLFAKSDAHRAAAHSAFDDAGRYVDDMHDRHRMPSREQVNPGIPLPSSGDGAFIAQDHYADDDQRDDSIPAEYRRFSEMLEGLHEELKSIKAGQRVLASVFHDLLKGDEITDDDDQDEPSAEELDKALEHVRAGGALPGGLEVQHKSVEEVLLQVMGRSKGSSTPPSFRKAGAVPREVAIRQEIERLQDGDELSPGEGIQALDILNRVQACKEGALAKSAVTESLRRAHPSVRGIFENHGIRLPQQGAWVEGL